MRVTRILFLLIILCIAVPVGIAAYTLLQTAQTETAATTGGLPQINDAQLAQIAAAQGVSVDQLQQRMAAFQQGGGAPQFAAAAPATELALLGTVNADETASVNFQGAGEVAEVLVSEGDRVTAGTVLARLDTTSAQRSVADARLSLEDAQLDLAALLEPPTDDEIESARLALVSAQASYSDSANNTSETQLQTAQLRLQQSQDAYDLAVQERANMGGTPESLALQDAEVGAASMNLEIARLNLQDLQTPSNQGSLWSAGIRVQMAELEHEQALSGASQSQIASAELAVQIAELTLANAETDLARLDITAPISGIITALNIDPGASVTAATAAVVITNVDTLWLSAPLHELDLDQVYEGMSAAVSFDALPDESFPATLQRIDWIGVESDGIVEYTVWFAVQTTDSRVRPGMTGEATIDLTQSA